MQQNRGATQFDLVSFSLLQNRFELAILHLLLSQRQFLIIDYL